MVIEIGLVLFFQGANEYVLTGASSFSQFIALIQVTFNVNQSILSMLSKMHPDAASP